MWLFTVHGFYSAVKCDERRSPLLKGHVAVRARVKQHLVNLHQFLPRRWKIKPVIREDKHADYRFRMFLPQRVWASIVRRLAKEIDYSNFKGAVHSRPTTCDAGADARYAAALNRIWAVTLDLQPSRPAEVDSEAAWYDELNRGYERDR